MLAERYRLAPNAGEMEKMTRMKQLACAAFLPMFFTVASLLAQDQPVPSLEDLLKTQYKVTRTGSDSEGFKILEPGTVVVLKKPEVMATEQGGAHKVTFKLFKTCDNTFKNGALSVSKACATTSIGSKYLNNGEKMYITKFEVNEKSSKITFDLVECDSCNGVTKPSSRKATIVFEFASKFLDTAEPGQVTEVINQVFEPQRAGS